MERLIVAPAGEPIDLGALKAHLRIDATDQDEQIAAYALAARKMIEDLTGRAMIVQTWRTTLDSFYPWRVWTPSRTLNATIELARAPVISVDSIKYIDGTGALVTLNPIDYQVDIVSEPARILPSYNGGGWPTWPATLWSPIVPVPNAVQIDYKAGYGGTGDDVEPALIQAIKLLVGHWYENREASVDSSRVLLPLGVAALIAPHRLWWRGRDH